MAGYLSVIGIQLKQYLVSALMCQRKSAFSAEFPNIRWFNETLVQNHIISCQKSFFGSEADDPARFALPTPIDQFASDYLNLKVSFQKLSSDGSIYGLTAYVDTEYQIEVDGSQRTTFEMTPSGSDKRMQTGQWVSEAQILPDHLLRCRKRTFDN